MSHPLGGFARRASYIKSFTLRYGRTPQLQVDTGALLASPSAGDALINKAMIASLKTFNIDAVNLSSEDLYYFSPPEGSASAPSIPEPFLSANISWKGRPLSDLKSSLVKSVVVSTTRGPKTLRLGITGVADPGKPYRDKSFTIADPATAARTVVEGLRSRCDLLILLTDLPQPKAAQLAQQVNGIDIIIDGEQNPFPNPPDKINDTFILGASYQGRHLGELKIYLDEAGDPARYKARYIGLDSGIPDDPVLGNMVASTRKELSEFHRKLAGGSTPASAKTIYAGSARCSACHATAHTVWTRSAHAHAIDTLKAKGQEFNPQCVRCHSTGFGIEGGFVNLVSTPDLANVHCEACHGPGLAHAQNPAQRLVKQQASVCLPCHTSLDSPNFNYEKAWAQIKH